MVYKYQGMKGEQLLIEFMHSMLLGDMILTAENELNADVKEIVEARTKEGLKVDKINKTEKRRQERKVSRAERRARYYSLQPDL